jgi:hypothetical protein
MPHSKYYNLNSPRSGWTSDEFARAVLMLESLSHETLAHLIAELGIRFSHSDPNRIDEEEMIAALLNDVDKSTLLKTLSRLNAA